MKAVMISRQPKWCELIISGQKTIICKTRPKIETPFKCYIYQTTKKVTETVKEYDSNLKILRRKKTLKEFRGEVIGEFVCDEIIKIGNYQEVDHSYMLWVKDKETTEKLCENACLSEFEIQDYLGKNGGYGWHISDLKIYDKPKELQDFKKPCCYTDGSYCLGIKCEYYSDWSGKCCHIVERPFQSWGYVEELEVE